ncbi:unnamed protein product [Linum tenue]|uniref:Uncharacterized protein n=1 Tax=Linum tenue TaxID=586396 RepID=A0AAV0LK17_9ROSI|nr:unnamed protein product [Linum tenue]
MATGAPGSIPSPASAPPFSSPTCTSART